MNRTAINRHKIEIVERYHTGTVKTYRCGDLLFGWTDWVLCWVSWRPSNPVHLCLASSFRSSENKRGETSVNCTLLNPGYDKLEDFLEIDKLHVFQPFRVIEESRQEPPALHRGIDGRRSS